MTKIIEAVRLRVEVSDLDSALPVYRALAATDEVRRIDFPQFRIAIVGALMLLEGTVEQLAPYRHSATLIASDHNAAVGAFTAAGGRVLEDRTASVAGTRSIVSDRDGNSFELFTPPGREGN